MLKNKRLCNALIGAMAICLTFAIMLTLLLAFGLEVFLGRS
jgi:hypothetical protein